MALGAVGSSPIARPIDIHGKPQEALMDALMKANVEYTLPKFVGEWISVAACMPYIYEQQASKPPLNYLFGITVRV